jgi:DNA-binding IclR family transcriptional regulator
VTLATGRPVGVSNPERVAEKQLALLAVIAASPGLRACEIVTLVTEPPAATATRLARLMDRGEVERVGRRWYAAGAAPNDPGALDLSIDDERMLSAMRIIPGGSSAEIAALVGVSRSSVLGRAQRLARLGVITKGPGGRRGLRGWASSRKDRAGIGG